MKDRRQSALRIRQTAAELARSRPHEPQQANDEEYRYRFDSGDSREGQPSFIGRFTKGLPHDDDGFLLDPRDYDDFSEAIESGSYEEFRRVRIGPRDAANGDRDTDTLRNPPAAPTWHANPDGAPVRKWESPTAGHCYDLEGPDAQALATPPAPELDSDELIAEVAEVYAMALLRDVPFGAFGSDARAAEVLDALAQLRWFGHDPMPALSPAEAARRRCLVDAKPTDLFRGITAGDRVGPYLSQFLLVGSGPRGAATTDAGLRSGQLDYGAVRVDLRVREATPGLDFMTLWTAWLDVQNGVAPQLPPGAFVTRDDGTASYKHLSTPRDMATYVHYDQLYEAYLNAALLLLEIGAPFDRGLPLNDEPTQTGFATFGGPHLLALLTEVSSRALKAVRYQKFNVHRRPRPEAIGGLLDLFDRNPAAPHGVAVIGKLHAAMQDTGLLDAVRTLNQGHNGAPESPLDRAAAVLLPMAFAEGSPMHPAYGAGHATVAGACTTILKAWFDCDHELGFAYQASDDGATLEDVSAQMDGRLTVGGELDKLAANISIARNMGGVHYFTDYWESLLLGEKIALGILEEQKLTYPESFRLTVPRFRPAPTEKPVLLAQEARRVTDAGKRGKRKPRVGA